MVKSKNTLGSDVSVRNMIQVPENINRNSRETIIYTFFKENVFFHINHLSTYIQFHRLFLYNDARWLRFSFGVC